VHAGTTRLAEPDLGAAAIISGCALLIVAAVSAGIGLVALTRRADELRDDHVAAVIAAFYELCALATALSLALRGDIASFRAMEA